MSSCSGLAGPFEGTRRADPWSVGRHRRVHTVNGLSKWTRDRRPTLTRIFSRSALPLIASAAVRSDARSEALYCDDTEEKRPHGKPRERRSQGWSLRSYPHLRSGAFLEAIAVIAGLDDFAAVREPVQKRRGHLGVSEHVAPLSEGEVGWFIALPLVREALVWWRRRDELTWNSQFARTLLAMLSAVLIVCVRCAIRCRFLRCSCGPKLRAFMRRDPA